MTSMFDQPLEIRHDRIDPVILAAVQRIDGVMRECNARYFLAGATAREVILRHVFGRGAGRRTLDVDFGVAVENWDTFESLKSVLVARANFAPHPRQKQRLIDTQTSVIVDLIPFGGVEHEGTISWPPDEDMVMRVAGFQDALGGAVPVRLAPELVVSVVTLPLLFVLKLFAWKDRKSEKRDAEDIYTLLRHYGDAGNEDRLYGEYLELLESEGFNFESAGATLLGIDAATGISLQTRKQLAAILNSDEEMSQLTDQMITVTSNLDRSTSNQCELLVGKARAGFFKSS